MPKNFWLGTYGTEQGFSGHGGDNQLREAMFDKATADRNLLNTQCTMYQEIARRLRR